MTRLYRISIAARDDVGLARLRELEGWLPEALQELGANLADSYTIRPEEFGECTTVWWFGSGDRPRHFLSVDCIPELVFTFRASPDAARKVKTWACERAVGITELWGPQDQRDPRGRRPDTAPVEMRRMPRLQTYVWEPNRTLASSERLAVYHRLRYDRAHAVTPPDQMGVISAAEAMLPDDTTAEEIRLDMQDMLGCQVRLVRR